MIKRLKTQFEFKGMALSQCQQREAALLAEIEKNSGKSPDAKPWMVATNRLALKHIRAVIKDKKADAGPYAGRDTN